MPQALIVLPQVTQVAIPAIPVALVEMEILEAVVVLEDLVVTVMVDMALADTGMAVIMVITTLEDLDFLVKKRI